MWVLLEKLGGNHVHSSLVALINFVSILIDFQAHNDTIAKHNAIHTRPFFGRLLGVIFDDKFPAFNINLSFDIFKECILVFLELIPS
ncbi:hypothetical protein FR483_n149L [Paramecium bursaria Chlorella virus FR483]|uniref:Uncharacterized protein n149L n=1 Tax=Paramecium bursaria Chlorella virus FR483 TaxID=399781 RepID=A7J6K3_PBCVF|nr:hypothetical protein FR483_n149L [Paramecium bursaria Chlorella virus FR483]ABT15434.1 hypothetical protein FR483_n149L [Paramecium bursaria Chlorella virus FR483]